MLKIGYLGQEGTYSSHAAKIYDKENLGSFLIWLFEAMSY